tara:strand:+ start:123 stop:461 length:339 start_codon:yes stop_codon:yes gene_type:complete
VSEIILIPVENNPNGGYTLQEVGGTIAGVIFGLFFLTLFVRGQTKIRKNRIIQEQKCSEQREKDPNRNTDDWQQHQRRLIEFGESKYRGTHFYKGPKGGVYYITYRGTKVYC